MWGPNKKVVAIVQSLSCIPFFVIPWTAAGQASLSFSISQSWFKPMSIDSVMLSNYLLFCCPLLLLSSIFPSTGIFSNGLALRIRWPKYWSFSFSISSSSEHSGRISFAIDWFDFPVSRGLLRTFCSTAVGRHQFFVAQCLWPSSSHTCSWPLEKPQLWL